MGGSGGGGGGESPYTDEQRNLLQSLVQYLQPQIGMIGQYSYGGQMVPDWQTFQNTFFDWVNNYGKGPQADQMNSALTQALSGKPSWDVSPERYTADFDTMVRNPAMIQQQDAIRQIEHRYGSTGAGGALIQGALDSTRDFETNMSGQRAGFALEGEKARDLAMNAAADRAAGVLPFAQEAQLTPGRILDYAGQMQAAHAAAQNQEAYLKWYSSFENPILTQFLGPALGIGPNIQQSAGSQLAEVGTGLGGAGYLAGALGQLA
jgi:hypothetical protein